ncbi:MAG: hypothetical protein NTW52_17235 [Planctomycetota bacterium]|nr:hypothetical protein [Planctomycetota bacterium]
MDSLTFEAIIALYNWLSERFDQSRLVGRRSMQLFIRSRISSLISCRSMVFGVVLAAQSLVACSTFASDDPEMLGVLPLILKPEIAQQMTISPSQQDRIAEVIEARREEALDLASQLRALPPAERPNKMRDLVREIEKRGAAVLNLQQRSQMERLRISEQGLSTLADPDVAQTLELSAGQAEQVQMILGLRGQLSRELGGEAAANAEVDRRLRDQLTPSQWSTWQAMAGQSAKKPTSTAAVEASSPSNSIDNQKAPPAMVPDGVAQAPAAADSQIDSRAAANLPTAQDPATLQNQTSDRNTKAPSTAEMVSKSMEIPLTINFKATPWEQVLQWIAGEAELSLQADAFPPGTFTYRDPYRTYTVGEALDVMNGVLLSKGYRLVRRQRSLMVIDLGNGESPEVVRGLIRELAELVSPEELDNRGEYELLKCLFVLSRQSPEEAQKEIMLLIGPEGSTVPLPSASQILVTETAGKLKLIREMLSRVENPDNVRGSKIVTIPLKFVTAEEVLAVARPLLGLKEATNQSEDLNVSTDTFGNTIYATGSPDKLQKLSDFVLQIDVKPDASGPTSVTIEQPTLKTHRILSSDPDTALSVLQTLLAGSANVRMALEPKTNSIVASGTQADHKLIIDTLAELAGQNSSFNIVQLNRIDTQSAILTLEKFFGKTSSKEGDATGGPIFFGDLASRTIMVKGSPQEVEQVKDLISKLEETGPQADLLGKSVRVLPMTGKNADRALEQIQYLWEAKKKKNRIQIRLPASEANKPDEESIREAQPETREPSASIRKGKNPTNSPFNRLGRLVATQITTSSDLATASSESVGIKADVQSSEVQPNDNNAPLQQENENEGADIMIFRGPNGLIVTSDDPEALEEFEQLARMVTEQMSFGPTEPTVFYLKFVSAKAASELLNSILSGEASSSGGGGGGLLGSVLGEVGGGLVGSLLGGGGGGSDVSTISGGMASGEISMTADPRLNCLVVRANSADLDLISDLLETIDQEDSPTKIETSGKVRLIQVVNNSVEEIAAVVKQVFADRIAAAPNAGGGGGGQQRQPSPQEFMEALRGGGGGRGGRGGGASSELKQATMTVGTDVKNNTLIITSSQNLYDEVTELVTMLDQAALEKEEKVEVVQLDGSVNATVLQNALRATFGAQAKSTNVAATSSNSSSPSSSGNSSSSSSGSPSSGGGFDPAAAAQRAEFFRQFQGGGPGGFGRGGGGGPPGFGGFGGFGSGDRGGDRGGSGSSQGGDAGRSRSRGGR